MEYYRPHSIEEAVYLKTDEAQYIAGGTDLGVLLADDVISPGALIDLCGISELNGVEETDEGLLIGACTRIAEIAALKLLPACLVQGAEAIGSPQIRNVATIGGNICNASPCGDTLTPLCVLDAVFTLQGQEERRKVAAADFFTGPKQTVMKGAEILTDIFIPKAAASGLSGFRMIGKRNGQVISQVNAAVRLNVKNGRISEAAVAAGSVAPVPLRLRECETLLTGTEVSELAEGSGLLRRLSTAAEKEITPISDVRAGEDYRRAVGGTMIAELTASIVAEDV